MNRPFLRSFSFFWFYASLLGAAGGSLLGFILMRGYLEWADGSGTAGLLPLLLILPMMGLGMGLAQGRLLRPYIPQVRWWPIVTLTGWVFGLSVDFLFRRAVDLPEWVTFVLVGFYLGGLQWLVLFRRLPFAAVWIPVNPLVWGVLFELVSLGERFLQLQQQPILLSVIVWTLAGGVYGLITGPLMQWLIASLSFWKVPAAAVE